MIITDVFEHKGKTAIYCKTKKIVDKKMSFSKVYIDNETFDIIEYDRLKSISGETSFALLIDTNKQFEINKQIEVI